MRPARITAAVVIVLAGFVVVAAHAGPGPKEWNPIIDPAHFVATVDNPYFPLPAGAVWTYRGTSKAGVETLEIEVRPGTKFILGIPTTIVLETAKLDGQVIEVAENWFAQDDLGNVWYFGEATQEFDGGVPGSTAGSWEAGAFDARPGIIMEAEPRKGDAYFQEFAAGTAQDQAVVVATGGSEAVSYGVFNDVVVTREWTSLEGNSVERKSYARGVGLILEKKGGSRLELESFR